VVALLLTTGLGLRGLTAMAHERDIDALADAGLAAFAFELGRTFSALLGHGRGLAGLVAKAGELAGGKAYLVARAAGRRPSTNVACESRNTRKPSGDRRG
jgi:hypothetical protein